MNYTNVDREGAYILSDDESCDYRKVNGKCQFIIHGESIERFHELEHIVEVMDELIRNPLYNMSAMAYHNELKRRISR